MEAWSWPISFKAVSMAARVRSRATPDADALLAGSEAEGVQVLGDEGEGLDDGGVEVVPVLLQAGGRQAFREAGEGEIKEAGEGQDQHDDDENHAPRDGQACESGVHSGRGG